MRSRLKWHFSDSAASRSCDVFLNRVCSNYSFTELSILDQLRH